MDNNVKFIQLHKDAKPIRHDGFGYRFKCVNAVLTKKRDGRDMLLLFTGWKIVLPEGYIGQVYDMNVANVISGFRQQAAHFVTNDFPYEKEGELAATGFYVSYFPTGGLGSIIYDPQVEYFGVSVFKIQSLSKMVIEQDIVKIEKKEGEASTDGNVTNKTK